ncbi:MAG TPA: glycosyltransferase [Candidatus Saccharimonadales bacterium]
MRKKILVICHDIVGKNMAGPGMRYTHVAEVLSKKFDVTLAVLTEANKGSDEIVVIDPSEDGYQKYFDGTDYIFAQWLSDPMIDYAKSKGKLIAFDLYAPVPIEYLASLEFSSEAVKSEKDDEFNVIIAMYNHYFEMGDVFTCSNERQRDFWTGYITANGIFKPSNFKQRQTLDNLLICPMGTSVGPIPKKMRLRNSIKGINKDDFVMVWTGGIWDWFDGRLVVDAMARVNDPTIKLVFLGNKHPNSIYKKETAETTATRKRAAELGLTNKTIFFLDGWIPYNERAAYFMDSDAAIYADRKSLETRFSHRTRVLDHFWMEIPTICTEGDYMSEAIAKNELGVVVKERTPEAFANAILSLKSDPKRYKQIKQNLHQHKKDFTWEKTLQPLVDFLLSKKNATIRTIPLHTSGPVAPPTKISIKRRLRLSAKMLLLGK